MKVFPFLIFLCLFFLFGCNAESVAEHPPEAPIKAKIDPETLRSLYKEYLAIRADPLPVRQIKEKGKIYPIDEAPLDTAFFVFKNQLIEAIEQKDVIAFLEKVEETILFNFKNENDSLQLTNDLGTFIEYWKLDQASKTNQSPIWEMLLRVLEMGGTFNAAFSSYKAPYVAATLPQDFSINHGVITGSGVRIRSAPSLQSDVVAKLSFDIVEVLEVRLDKKEIISGETHPWVKIKLINSETEGFVYGKYLWSFDDYAIQFANQNGTWKIVRFLQGA